MSCARNERKRPKASGEPRNHGRPCSREGTPTRRSPAAPGTSRRSASHRGEEPRQTEEADESRSKMRGPEERWAGSRNGQRTTKSAATSSAAPRQAAEAQDASKLSQEALKGKSPCITLEN